MGSPSVPRPSENFRTTVLPMPLRRSTWAVPDVASTSKPSSASRFTGKMIERLSRSATDTNTRPSVGSPPNAAACDFANACGKSLSKPMTSPVERISGPSTVSTTWPSAVRNRLNGSTASLTASGAPRSSVPPSPSAGRTPAARSSAIDSPTMTRAAALDIEVPVALDTNGTVRDARGFASSTYRTSETSAYCTLSRPRTPTPFAMASVERRMRSISAVDSDTGGSTQAESPEWMPASSMCSMTPPRNISSPSYRASTSISIASSRKRSMSSGAGSRPPAVRSSAAAASRARSTYSVSCSAEYTISMPRPPSTYDGRTSTG